MDNHKKIEIELKEKSLLQQKELLEQYKVTIEGYNELEAAEKLEQVGKNKIRTKQEKSFLKRIQEAIINPFNVVLILVGMVTFLTDIVFTKQPSYATFILILVTVFISAIISFREQEKSNQAAKKLEKMITNKVDVIRHGQNKQVDIENIIPGDIVKLSSGDMLPGDVRFLQVKDLFIDQATLTGESLPVEKQITAKPEEELTSLENIWIYGNECD